MDAINKKTKRDHSMFAFLRDAAVLFFLFGFPSIADAQQLVIRSRDRDQELTHNLQSNTQIFPQVLWDIHNSSAQNGMAVVWVADAFESRGNGKTTLADTGLALRIRNAGPKDAWQVTQATGQTSVATGDRSAFVAASCSRHGEATMEILVSFRTESSVPAAGKYRTQLIGTITAP